MGTPQGFPKGAVFYQEKSPDEKFPGSDAKASCHPAALTGEPHTGGGRARARELMQVWSWDLNPA